MDSNYIVQTGYGKVRGFLQKTLLDVPYIRFLGIPYATPPTDNLRFNSPARPTPWGDNVIDCDEEKSPCAGFNSVHKRFVGSDDCLYLNVFTKNINPKIPTAVMVYIYGGGHCRGSSSLDNYSPDWINKDQQLAMQFVKENIRNFGGDPNNCTLFGHSSDATCIGLHCMAESSRGLFNKAIIMSGSAVADESVCKDKSYAIKLAKKLGFNEGDSENDVLAFLEKANLISIAEAQQTFFNSDANYLIAEIPFGPCIEPYDNDSGFMLNEPIDLLKSAWSNDIDVMIGGTADEGLINKSQFENNLSFESIIPRPIKLKVSEEKLKKFENLIRDFYLTRFPTGFDAFVKFNGDASRWLAMQRLIHSRQNSHGNGRTFFYRFAVDSPTQNLWGSGNETRNVFLHNYIY